MTSQLQNVVRNGGENVYPGCVNLSFHCVEVGFCLLLPFTSIHLLLWTGFISSVIMPFTGWEYADGNERCGLVFWFSLVRLNLSFLHDDFGRIVENVYESIATVGESRVWKRANFQSGSRVLKRCSEPFLIYIYGIQCDFMPKSCWKHSNFENR